MSSCKMVTVLPRPQCVNKFSIKGVETFSAALSEYQYFHLVDFLLLRNVAFLVHIVEM